jgi:hypothetical protein
MKAMNNLLCDLEDFIEVPLGPDLRYSAKISCQDLHIMDYKWHVSAHGKIHRLYAVRFTGNSRHKQTKIFMHREILRPGTGMVSDHINGDSLDNRRHNLRELTHGENARLKRAAGYVYYAPQT